MKIVILDRDGVINHDSPSFIKNESEWIPIDNSIEAIAILCQHNYNVIVCTNQSAVGRKLLSLEELQAINKKMISTINAAGGKLAAIFYCPHVAEDNCMCRKPKSGMLLNISAQFKIQDFSSVHMVGDSLRDLLAIHNVGGIPVLVKSGNGQQTLYNKLPHNTIIFNDLYDFTQYLIKDTRYEKK